MRIGRHGFEAQSDFDARGRPPVFFLPADPHGGCSHPLSRLPAMIERDDERARLISKSA
jgi:hypothetical protein